MFSSQSPKPALEIIVFGGVPYYLTSLSNRFSINQNIDNLCFNENGKLYDELEELYASLYDNYEDYLNVIFILSKVKQGLTREEIIEKAKSKSGGTLTKLLKELESCSFIRKYNNKAKGKNNIYQLIDPFTMFAVNYMKDRKISSWQTYASSSAYYSWAGYAFENVCLNNVESIIAALGIKGIQTTTYSFKSKQVKDGAQIDLVIDRSDDVINLIEIKYSKNEFEIDDNYYKVLNNKIEVFKNETKTKKSLFLTFVTANNLKHNEYSDIVVDELNLNDLFLV